MHIIDLSIFTVYMIVMLGVGYFFLRRNKNPDDYFVGGRTMGSLHVGLSVVATDVGGGFSIGLGGLGFAMGLSGSWMLFTGLIGAWISAALLIPKVATLMKKMNLYTFPQIFDNFYSKRVALVAGIISAIGYIGFTSSQILAGAKLAAASFIGLNMNTALIIMGTIAVIYTVMGGLKAVIYTDTIQWIILMSGLIFIGIPLGYHAIGGMDALRDTVRPELLTLTNITWQQLVNWGVTIIPIWFVGMTLYQRIYSTRGKKQAQRAWFIAGVFEWPLMAFMGVILGLFSRVALDQGMFAELGYTTFESIDPEMGLPLLLRTILPVGLMGLMMSAYFSAIMSTADSCLMAASGNVQTDILRDMDSSATSKNTKAMMKSDIRGWGIPLIIMGVIQIFVPVLDTLWGGVLIAVGILDIFVRQRFLFIVTGIVIIIAGIINLSEFPLLSILQFIWGGNEIRKFFKYSVKPRLKNDRSTLRTSQFITLFIGILALTLAWKMENVLELMLYSYAFMVSGLFIPLLGAFFGKRKNSLAAIWAMMIGGSTTLILTEVNVELPLGLDPNIFGISASLVIFIMLTHLFPKYSTYKKL